MFRIWIYLTFKNFYLALTSPGKITKKKEFIKFYIKKQSNKTKVFLFSQCRVAFLFILKFLKNKNKNKNYKNEIVFCSYNLPEMINIALNLKLKVKFCDLDHKSGLINHSQVKKQVSKKTDI